MTLRIIERSLPAKNTGTGVTEPPNNIIRLPEGARLIAMYSRTGSANYYYGDGTTDYDPLVLQKSRGTTMAGESWKVPPNAYLKITNTLSGSDSVNMIRIYVFYDDRDCVVKQ